MGCEEEVSSEERLSHWGLKTAAPALRPAGWQWSPSSRRRTPPGRTPASTRGIPETVYAEGKRPDDLAEICERLLAAHGRLLVTRLAPERGEGLIGRLGGATYRRRPRQPHRPAAKPPGKLVVQVLTSRSSSQATFSQSMSDSSNGFGGPWSPGHSDGGLAATSKRAL
jgi:hypothetical protein